MNKTCTYCELQLHGYDEGLEIDGKMTCFECLEGLERLEEIDLEEMYQYFKERGRVE